MRLPVNKDVYTVDLHFPTKAKNKEDIQNLSVCLQIAARWHLPLRTADQAYRTISTN